MRRRIARDDFSSGVKGELVCAMVIDIRARDTEGANLTEDVVPSSQKVAELLPMIIG